MATYSEKSPTEKQVLNYQTEFKKWEDVLKFFHTGRFAKNYRQYTAYTDTKGTTTQISDPVAPEMIERIVQKLFENPPRFYCLARGKNLPPEVTDIISSVASYLWTNPKMTQSTGPMKQKLKLLGREFLITGNTVVETYYNPDSDNPDIRVLPIEDVIFDPVKGLKRSPVYYVRQYVTLSYLEDMVEVTDKGKVIAGRFKASAIDAIKKRYTNADGEEIKTQTPTTDETTIIRSGAAIGPSRDQILLISRYEGTKVCRIVDWLDILEEEDDVLGIGEDPLDQAMDIELVKEPYANSFLDFINGLTTAKDLILNQVVDYGSKALNPPLFVDPSVGPISKATLANAYKPGGVVFANINQAQHQPMAPLPTVGFDLMNYIQTRSESVANISAYLGGVTNTQSDKTQGTAAGINTLTQSAQSPVKDRQINIEESIIEPIVNKWLRVTGNMMGDNEIKYILLTGQGQKWVKVTKGILTGKITLPDLLTAELIDEAGAMELAQIMASKGQDPNKEILFDVDWLVRVETNSMAEVDTALEIQGINNFANFRAQFRIPTDYAKLSEALAQASNLKNPEQYDIQDNPQNPQSPNASTGSTMPFVPPKETIAFKDLPPAGQIQMAANAGIQLQPQDLTQPNPLQPPQPTQPTPGM